jgi:UDP-galactopyranose mutase
MLNPMQILIVGAGFSGATVARMLAEAGLKITIIAQRNHVAGNAYDYENQYSIRVHKYGPHLFHTSNLDVVNFLSKFTAWTPYQHKVKAMLSDGRLVTLPVNKETAELVGNENIVDIFYRPYTKKMWDLDIEEVDPEILNRVNIRDDSNELYFPNDSFQALPSDGYTKLIQKMLSHPLIEVRLETPFEKPMLTNFDHCFNSMSIDEFFDNIYGSLPYRSIKFHTQSFPVPRFFPVAVVNFTHKEKFTRVTEWKNLPNHEGDDEYSTLTFEEPCDFKENNFERFYPVKDLNRINRTLYNRYCALIPPNLTFIGRCGLYAYLDMHQAVASAMSIASKFLSADHHPNPDLAE